MEAILLLQSQELAEAALKTNPYNAIAYGVLVLVLITAVIFIWKEYTKTKKRHQDYVEKTVGLLQLMESKMDTIEEVKKNQGLLKENSNSTLNKLTQVKTIIENKK